MKKSINLLLVGLFVFLGGCANQMALDSKQSQLNGSAKGIALLSVRIANQVNPDSQLDITGAIIVPKSKDKCSDWDTSTKNQFATKSPNEYVKKQYKEYLMSFELHAGTNTMMYLNTKFEIPLILCGYANVPVFLETQIKPGSTVYLGHLDIVLRKIKDKSEKSANIFPLVDAAIIGYSGGIFDVVVEDRFDEDMKAFRSKYPVLNSTTVEKAILPQWTRPGK